MFGLTFGDWLRQEIGGLVLWQWLGIAISLLGGFAVGLVLARGLKLVFENMVRRTDSPWDDIVVHASYRPLRGLCIVSAMYLLLMNLRLPAGLIDVIAKVSRAACIAFAVWAAIRALYRVAETVSEGQFTKDTVDPERLTRARVLRTQLVVTNRILSVVIFLLGAAAMALQFDLVRSVGMSLLASAGVAGVALGFAAQKSLGAILAGLQISLSQPIRIGDHVLLQGEFGVIEDIGLTYVAVKLWDDRRLMVPTVRFLEEPLQNWSRSYHGLTGSVFLRVGFDTPLNELRQELERLLAQQALWDGRIKTVQVTEAGERSLEVRILVSARSPGDLFDLRAAVREGLVRWLGSVKQGEHLPRARLAMLSGGESEGVREA